MIHGLIVVHKEKGISSHAVVEQIRKLLGMQKAGHFGTLDPSATGIVLIALGHATRLFNFYVSKEKLYAGVIKFGYATTTYDAEGEPLGEAQAIDLRRIDIEALLEQFTGAQLQYPPPYSAKKFKGQPLYKYARRHHPVALKPSRIQIHELRSRIIDPTRLHFEARTSAGTYIRSLAHDIGQRVGVGAYLEELTRRRIGEFGQEQALPLETIRQHAQARRLDKFIIPIEAMLPELPKVIVSAGGQRSILNGMPLPPGDILKIYPSESREHFRIFSAEGKLLAIAKKNSSGVSFKPHIVFPEESGEEK